MVIVVGSIARCIIFGVPRLPIRPCDERPPAMYGHFCLVPGVSVHDRYYCILRRSIFCSCDMRFISGQNVWDCDLLGGVIPIDEAAASSMAFTAYFRCICVFSAASNALLSSFMREVRCCL